MKKVLFLAAALLVGLCAAAQDIVVKRDGSWIRTSHLSAGAGKFYYVAEGDTTMTLHELKRSELAMILYSDGRVADYNDLRLDRRDARPLNSLMAGNVCDDMFCRDYMSAVSLRNAGTGLMASGALFTTLGTYMTLFIGPYGLFFLAVGPAAMIAGIPCYAVGERRMKEMELTMKFMTGNEVSVPVIRGEHLGLDMTGGGGSTGISLSF